MLTVKHISDGRERICPAFYVDFNPAHMKKDEDPRDTVVAYTEARFVAAEFDSGHVYVMNDNGATVGSYSLGLPKADKAAGPTPGAVASPAAPSHNTRSTEP